MAGHEAQGPPTICIGMPRSASRMTWQIVRHLSGPEPEGFQESTNTLHGTTGLVWPWPTRSHAYVEGTEPVVYTYRNPIEAYLSLTSRTADGSRDDHMDRILEQLPVLHRLRLDEEQGRRVLRLRYEDYFGDEDKKVQRIADFMNVPLSVADRRRIVEMVGLDSNHSRAKAYPDHVDPDAAFEDWVDPDTGMQGNHINEVTMGAVGAHLILGREEVARIVAAPADGRAGRLRDFALTLGYPLPPDATTGPA